jgi:transcriptional regulator with XRE-family HTH domain
MNDEEFLLFLNQLGKMIKIRREEAKLTQEQMSEGDEGIEYKYYRKIEAGKINITMETVFKICRRFNISPSALFNDK